MYFCICIRYIRKTQLKLIETKIKEDKPRARKYNIKLIIIKDTTQLKNNIKRTLH